MQHHPQVYNISQCHLKLGVPQWHDFPTYNIGFHQVEHSFIHFMIHIYDLLDLCWCFFFKPQKYDLSYKHHIIQIVGDTKYINNVEE